MGLTGARRVSDGTRTRDHLDHNQELYQLSYAHRAAAECTRRLRGRAPGQASRCGAKRCSRSAFATTETLESPIAAPAIAGFSSPAAASGIAAML